MQLFRFKKRRFRKPGGSRRAERIYPQLTGAHYLEVLETIHNIIKPDWYLEVGISHGGSLEKSRAKTIAVDPKLSIHTKALQPLPEIHLFQMTSDDFFAAKKVGQLTSKIDLAFLDGMHRFEFLLRDFMNTEQLCSGQSTIILHDCVPISAPASERHWDHKKTSAWTGDVWKLVPILKKYRPDLDIQVLDCPPSGLTVISNLDPLSTVLTKNYDKIVDEFFDQTITSFGKDHLWDILAVKSHKSFSANPA